MDPGNLVLVCMMKVCVCYLYRGGSSDFSWREAVGETAAAISCSLDLPCYSVFLISIFINNLNILDPVVLMKER